jgi:hypothetical protein
MTTINDGGPAFPMHPNSWEYGMTLRDWFAGQALAGMLANPDSWTQAGGVMAYRYADAMLKAREVKP